MTNIRSSLAVLALTTALMLAGSRNIYAQPHGGIILSFSSLWLTYSDCPRTDHNSILAGATALLNVELDGSITGRFPTSEFHGLSRVWPEGLTLQAGIISDSSWEIVPGLINRMDVARWNYGTALWEDSLWRATGREMSHRAKDTTWTFSFRVPEDLADRRVFFYAEYVNPLIGIVVSRTPHHGFVTVIPPCSVEDRDRALGSAVYIANRGGNHARAVAIADSLIPLGWCDCLGLAAATQAADYLKLTEKSIKYVDLNFAGNGRIYCFPYERPGSAESEAGIYHFRRRVLEQMLDEQQNQKR